MNSLGKKKSLARMIQTSLTNQNQNRKRLINQNQARKQTCRTTTILAIKKKPLTPEQQKYADELKTKIENMKKDDV